MQLLAHYRHHPTPFVRATCMFLLLLTRRSLSVSSGISSAGVYGLSFPKVVRNQPKSRGSLANHLVLLRATVGSGDEPSSEIGGEGNKKVPATGWNHNPPSESSRFWKAPNGDSAAARQQAGRNNPSSNGDDGKSITAPRTGWLHNTKPNVKPSSETKDGGNGISRAQQRLKQAMKQQEENHRIIFPAAFHACGDDRQIVVTEHRISVPVYRTAGRATPRIDVAFTIVEEVKDDASRKWFESLQSMSPLQRARAYVDKAALVNADDMLLYLQGGPGFGSPVPAVGLAFSKGSSWGAAALNKYKRIVLMDQRGTGQSTPITKQSLQQRFPDLFLLDGLVASGGMDLDTVMAAHPDESGRFQTALMEATDFMAQFRAVDIVKDAEMIREALLLPPDLSGGTPAPVPRPWGCSLGQSYGGFCTMSYLSLIDHPPQVALLTGGIAPMGVNAFDLYTALWTKVKERSLQYYSMYPGDIATVKKIVQKLLLEPPTLPSGGTLTARRFLQLGMMLGGSPSSFASMHNILSTSFLQPEETEFTRAFLKVLDNAQPFDEHPIYFWLHESIYADGPKFSPTNWSADRSFQGKITTQSELDYKLTSSLANDERPTLFFGEMVFPWMAQDYAECSGVGCAALANALAVKEDWGTLYDYDHMRAVLDDGRTRCAAAVYFDDIYVHFDSCMKVVARGGALEKCKVYITNDYQHSGLRDDGANLFDKLHGMATGSVRTPS